MEEVMPMEMISNNFKTHIHKLILTHKRKNVTFYQASTTFGEMTLIVQAFQPDNNQDDQKRKDNAYLTLLQKRNELIKQQTIVTPLVYEQEIIKIRQNYYICMTLSEPIQICRKEEVTKLRVQSIFQNLVVCAFKINQTQFDYSPQCYMLKDIVKSKHSYQIFIDYTDISIVKTQQKQNSRKEQCFRCFKRQLCAMLCLSRQGKMQELMFLRQKPFIFNADAILQATSWFDLAMMFNLLPQERVTVIRETKTKIYSMNKLNGCIKFQYNGLIYQNYNFYEGFRIDGIIELTLQALKANFFQQKILYYMTKDKYLSVRKKPIESEQSWILDDIQYEDMIIVKQEIIKVEFINFLIGYLKSVQPILHTLKFNSVENILQFEFTNKAQVLRKVVIKFPLKYVVKDQELSMIIQKSRLKATSIDLQHMNFGDSFLIFLANCDKMLNVKSLDISYCPKITDSGVNLLLASPFCKNLSILKICALPMIDLSVIKFKKQLKELHISDCVQIEDQEQVVVSQLNIERLLAIGVNVCFKFPQTLKYLSVSSESTLQSFKMFKHLSLVELKIKLVENKKNITSFFNNIYMRDNPVKMFCQGSSRKTLKILDISGSTIKVKQLKPILAIDTLQVLICQNMESQKLLDLTLPSNIMTFSVKGSKVNAEQLIELIGKSNILIKLNIVDTLIDENNIQSVLKTKKYISMLELGEEQLSFKLIEKKGCVQSITLHLHKLIRDQNQPILNHLLLSQIQICKSINFVCHQKHQERLTAKISRFLRLYFSKSKKNQPQININQIDVTKLINFKNKQSSHQFFNVINQKSAIHKQRIYSYALMSQVYGFPIMGEHLNLDLFNVTLHKIITLNPQSLLEISIRNNRILGKQVISLINHYAGSKLKSIDFRNCLFTYGQIQQQLFNFPCLQSVNEGEYEIAMYEDDNCEQQLQKILKFFMKLSQKDKMKLKITAQDINERQLYFSILYQILHHYSQNIVHLELFFTNIQPDQFSLIFWKKILTLSKVQNFHLHYFNEHVDQQQQIMLASEFQKISNFNLFSLEIDSSFSLLIPQYLNFQSLRKINLNFSQMAISDSSVHRVLKNVTHLTHITLKMQNCSNLTSVSKLSDSLQKMSNLIYLSLNVQNCPVKDITVYQLADNLKINSLLQHLDLNVNNCTIGVSQLVKSCLNVVETVKYCHICLFALQSKRVPFFRDINQLLAKGIELVFSN